MLLKDVETSVPNFLDMCLNFWQIKIFGVYLHPQILRH